MGEIKFKYIWSNPTKTNFINAIFTLDEIESGGHFEVLENEPLLKNYRLIARNQFTGLLDKNGKEIFEGDIVRRVKKEPSKFHFEIYNPNPLVSEVFYDKAGFFVKGITDMDFYLGAVNEKIEVIGNIYEHGYLLNENPELLEAK